MRLRTIVPALSLAILVAACGPKADDPDAPDALQLAAYFELPTPDGDILALLAPKLRELLGAYAGDGLRTDIKNASPNAVNMLLWYMAVDGLATDLAASCGEAAVAPTAFALAAVRPGFADAFSRLCVRLVVGDAAAADYAAVWGAVLEADAPQEEQDAWIAFARSDAFAGATPRETLKQLLVAMMYGPYFLLKQ
jgi:hypothetical protein